MCVACEVSGGGQQNIWCAVATCLCLVVVRRPTDVVRRPTDVPFVLHVRCHVHVVSVMEGGGEGGEGGSHWEDNGRSLLRVLLACNADLFPPIAWRIPGDKSVGYEFN